VAGKPTAGILKDVVMLGGYQEAEVDFNADNPGLTLFHCHQQLQRHSGGGGTHMIARLKPGATITEAQFQIDAHNTAVEKDNPDAKMMAEAAFRSPVLPLHADHVRSIPSDTLVDAGRHIFPLAHWRG
jgi:Multicopper oxidase